MICPSILCLQVDWLHTPNIETSGIMWSQVSSPRYQSYVYVCTRYRYFALFSTIHARYRHIPHVIFLSVYWLTPRLVFSCESGIGTTGMIWHVFLAMLILRCTMPFPNNTRYHYFQHTLIPSQVSRKYSRAWIKIRIWYGEVENRQFQRVSGFHRLPDCCWLKAKKPSNSWFQRPRSPRSAPIDEG
jgi:hypothetical protein